MCSTSDGKLVHLLLCVWVSTAADIAAQAAQYVDEIASTDDACNLGCLCIPETGGCYTLLMQCMEGLPYWQLDVQQHYFPAFGNELVNAVRAEEVFYLLAGVAWLVCLHRCIAGI